MTQIEKVDRGFEKHSGKVLVGLMLAFFTWFVSSHQSNSLEMSRRGEWMGNVDSKFEVIDDKLTQFQSDRFTDKEGYALKENDQELKELISEVRQDLKEIRDDLKDLDKRVFVLEKE